ncbi:MAG TPA: hypothetical protein VGO09_01415 [Flavisolibacter sp.]|jgi:hypothetical protein|nr:hypothetical protein [Flavisolibacter sp.]
MKNTILVAVAALFIGTTTFAQSTVDSIEAKYKLLPMPDSTISMEKTFPILGTYQFASTNNNAGNLIITLDSSNRGIVWIDGLPEGRIKAYLKQSPATYRIIPQKSSTGKMVPEGTVIYNTESNALNVSLGAPYNETDPGSIFENYTTNDVAANNSSAIKVKTKTATSKSKSRVEFYTASKTLTNSSSNAGKQ